MHFGPVSGVPGLLGARDEGALAEVVGSIRSAGGRAVAARTDVGDPASVRALVRLAVDEFGRLDAAFNNATDGPLPAPLADIDVDEFDQGIRTNVRGTFLGMKYEVPAMLASGGGAVVNMASIAGLRGTSGLSAYTAGKAGIIGLTKVAALDYADRGVRVNVLGMKYEVPAMLASGGGAVVNMASIAGLRGTSGLSAYTAGKAGIIGLTKVAALDYADRGVRVNVVAPGPILTHHLRRAGEEAQRLSGESVPMRRVGTTDEVADAVLWLCSDRASFVTGVTLPIDGGQFAGQKPPRMYRHGEGMEP